MFNQNSLKALTMRYALYYGRYELAAKLATEIIESGKYELHANYGDLFQYEGASANNEFIMHFDMASHGNSATQSFRDLGPHYRTSNGESYVVPLKSLVDAYWTLQGRPIADCPLHTKQEYELNPTLNRDPRYASSIMGHGMIFMARPSTSITRTARCFSKIKGPVSPGIGSENLWTKRMHSEVAEIWTSPFSGTLRSC